jgi:predicted lipoprotein with Yx(FWY)xxD motif
MQPTARSRPARRLTGLVLVALIAVFAVTVAGAGAKAQPSKRVVTVEETSGGGSVLANLKGRTLYSLSVEKHGKFICTGGCTSVWHPLLVPKGVKPTGPVALGTVQRPEGKTQVTYKGRPLYSFSEDKNKGETNGEGIKDVGTWHAAEAAASSAPQSTEPQPTPTSPYPTPTPPTTETPPKTPTQPPYEYPPYNY